MTSAMLYKYLIAVPYVIAFILVVLRTLCFDKSITNRIMEGKVKKKRLDSLLGILNGFSVTVSSTDSISKHSLRI